MPDNAKTVFISYRRALSSMTARAIFQELRAKGYDVFMDVESIDSGNFDTIILRQIAARMHFILVLEPGSLDRTVKSGDWLRREIEEAIRLKRNIVPVLADGFTFDKASKTLPEKLSRLPSYNGVNLYHDYFVEAIDRLITRFLKPQADIGLQPLAAGEQQATAQQMSKIDSPPRRQLPTPQLTLQTNSPPSPATGVTSKDTRKRRPYTFQSISQRRAAQNSLSWQPIDNATRYILQRSRDRTFSAALELYKGTNTSFVDHTLTDIMPYYYRVKAQGVNLAKDSAWSNVVESSRWSIFSEPIQRTSNATPKASNPVAPSPSTSPNASYAHDSGWLVDSLLGVASITFCVLLSVALIWLAGWGYDWLFNRLGLSLPFSIPNWLRLTTGILWGLLYVFNWMMNDSFATALFDPYSSMFDSYKEPGLIGSLLSAFPLNFILPYGIALQIPSIVTWVGTQGFAKVGWAPISVPSASVFWCAYGILILWGLIGYIRRTLD